MEIVSNREPLNVLVPLHGKFGSLDHGGSHPEPTGTWQVQSL